MIKQIYEQLMQHNGFSKFINGKNHDLAYFFTMIQNGMEIMNGLKDHKFQEINIVQEWQVGVVNQDDETILPYVFNVFEEDNKIKIGDVKIEKQSEAFKKPGDKIEKFDIGNLNFEFDDALKKALDIQKEKYPSHYPSRIIVLLQTIKGKQMWNITFLTMSFDVLNIRIDSATGKIISHNVSSLISNNNEIKELKNKMIKKNNN